MNHFLVLGAGKMGLVLAKDLIDSGPQNKVTLVDIDRRQLENARKSISSSRLEVLESDMEDEEQRESVCPGKDVIINALLHRHSLPVMAAAIRNAVHFVDLAGEAASARMAHDQKARDRGVTVLSGMGVSPGITNALVGRAVDLLDETENALIYCGGNPVEPRPPLGYRIVYALDSLINFYQRPALIIRGGEVEEVAPLSGLEPVRFAPDFPEMECFFTDGLSSLLQTMKGKIRGDLYEKTVRHRGHAQGFRTLRDCGLLSTDPVQVGDRRVSPRPVLETLLEERMKLGAERDVTLLRIVVSGKKSGVPQTHIFEMVDYGDPGKGQTSMARTTSFPASIASQMIAEGRISVRGVVFPEGIFDRDLFFPFMEGLAKRGVSISHKIVTGQRQEDA
ncbi:MAG: saccharopine dehydrogenase NADP-binding domain-containing protein [Candidatus Aminicenantes bacterium]|nr:saccharopine dehydrogenase NADP-binding domain-containing protein [Candidatus Aminicenantes bacterium]